MRTLTETINTWQFKFTAIVGTITAALGWFGMLVIAWVFLMGLDLATGIAKALKSGTWSSKIMRDGFFHKLGSISAIIALSVADGILGVVLAQLPVLEVSFAAEFAGLLCPLGLVWCSLTELGSIIENAIQMGAPLPKWAPKLFAVGKQTVDNVMNTVVGTTDNSTDTEDNNPNA